MGERGKSTVPLGRKAEAKDSGTAVRHCDVVRVIDSSESLVGDCQAGEDDVVTSDGPRGVRPRRRVAEEEVNGADLRLLERVRNSITFCRREFARVGLAGVRDGPEIGGPGV